MFKKPIDVLEQFPVRRSKEQKTAFIEAVTGYVKEQGYGVAVENGKRGVRNIVFGDLHSAKYLITAHYDTPASIGLPNFIVPNNPVFYFGIQIGLVAVLLAVAFAAGFGVYWFTGEKQPALFAGYIVYLVILMLMLKGPANRSNANDNTSGIVTLLETLTAMPMDARDKVCFVLFDMEEAGLVGSGIFRKTHKADTENKIVLNLDCVGDGSVIQFTPVKKARNDQALLDRLSCMCGQRENRELRLRSKGFYGGSSDHKNFPMGIAIMAFHQKKGIGLYCGRIHTWRDTILDTTNVSILRDALLAFVTEDSEKIAVMK